MFTWAFEEQREELRSVVKRVIEERHYAGDRRALIAFINSIGLTVLPGPDTPGHAREVDYTLALAYGQLGEAAEANEHMSLARVLPASGGDIPFHDHIAQAVAAREQRQKAEENGLPSFVIAAMPRAGSATLSMTLSGMFDMPLMRGSIGRFPSYVLITEWMREICKGGAVMHDHFGASAHNLDVLKHWKIDDVFVLIRDPRAAAASIAVMTERGGDAPPRSVAETERAILALYRDYVTWLEGWLKVAASARLPRVHWIAFDRVRSDMKAAWQQMADVLAPQYPSLEAHANADPAVVVGNFVTGDDNSWRRAVGPKSQTMMWAAMPAEIREILTVEP